MLGFMNMAKQRELRSSHASIVKSCHFYVKHYPFVSLPMVIDIGVTPAANRKMGAADF